MRRRYLFVAMFGVPAILAALLGAGALTGTIAGMFWIFIFGDNTWPDYAGWVLGAVFGVTFLAISIGAARLAYLAGLKAEAGGTLNAGYVALSALATAVLVGIFMTWPWGLDKMGSPPDDVACASFCRSHEFVGSSMPPRDSGKRVCGCIDAK